MSYQKDDLIQYRINKAQTTLQEAKSLADDGYWNGTVNRLYYSCFYAVIALLAKSDISARTHNGVRSEFFRLYIKSKILDKSYSSLYSNLMGKRHEIDYGDFQQFEKKDILPLINQVEEFISRIKELIEK
ncbi:MAG: HEPN domain-containing protein [Bacteroidales bacterium]|nr:HEPN domain-containing protein [Bacteroidales bacterium]